MLTTRTLSNVALTPRTVLRLLLLVSSGPLLGCASFSGNSSDPVHESASTSSKPEAKNPSLESTLKSLEEKITQLEAKLSTAQAALDQLVPPAPLPATHASTAPAQPTLQKLMRPAQEPKSQINSGSGTGSNASRLAENYRAISLQFQAGNYSEAILGFSTLVREAPNTWLAPAAQFYLGESYFEQKEWKLAHDEFLRCVNTYPRSSYVNSSLQRLVETSARLGKQEDRTLAARLLERKFARAPHYGKATTSTQKDPAATPTETTKGTNTPTDTHEAAPGIDSNHSEIDSVPGEKTHHTPPTAGPSTGGHE